VVGVSGSGKTSLAIGTLYAEGMQRFLESLSTYSRRRLSQARRPDVDRIDHLPPGRPYLEVDCIAQLGFASKVHPFATTQRRCREAIVLAERHGWGTDQAAATIRSG
jgi:hypothetical protein